MAHETIHVGLYVIFGIVMLPVYAMIVGWFVGKPRDLRTVGVTFGYLLAFTAALVVGLFVLDVVVSLLTPY